MQYLVAAENVHYAVTMLKQQHLLNFHKNNFLDILPNLHCQVNL